MLEKSSLFHGQVITRYELRFYESSRREFYLKSKQKNSVRRIETPALPSHGNLWQVDLKQKVNRSTGGFFLSPDQNSHRKNAQCLV